MLENVRTVVVGVSGGSDSVCLLHVLNKYRDMYKINIKAVHVNHNIRGDEADRDETFVKSFCDKLNIPLMVVSVKALDYSKEIGISTEEAGRILRYKAFADTCDKYKKNGDEMVVTAVAHNSNDNVETILFNVLRGSGIKGIAGIMPKRDNIIRPLLTVSKEEIEDYLKEEGVDFVVDSTNLGSDYTRNVIRNDLLPLVRRKINEGVDKTLLRLSDIANDTRIFVDESSREAYDKYCKDGEIDKGICDLPRIIRTETYRKAFKECCGKLKDVTREHMLSIDELWGLNTGARISLPYSVNAVKSYGKIKLIRTDLPDKIDKDDIPCDKESNNYEYTYEIIENKDLISRIKILGIYEKTEEIEENNKIKYTKYLDYDKINDSVALRTRESGDYMVINKDGNKKKINSILTDEKIPKEERDDILLLCQGNRVLWIVGMRGSVDTNIDEKTKKIMKIEVCIKKEAKIEKRT